MSIKKIKLYELDPRFFKDSSGDGVGDLKGLYEKMDYFDFLDVNGIVLQNILAINSYDSIQSFKKIAKELGTMNDFLAIIKKASGMNKKIFFEIGIGSIKETHSWFSRAKSKRENGFTEIIDFRDAKNKNSLPKGSEVKYNSETRQYYTIDSLTKNVSLNWGSSQVFEQFIKVINFWIEVGVSGFVFKDFEFIADPTKSAVVSPTTLTELQKFYTAIKKIDENLVLIGKSEKVSFQKIKSYTSGLTQIFDYFMPLQISLLGTSKKFGNDQLGKFKPLELANGIKDVVSNENNILTFGSNLSGRVNSRWGDHGQFSKESAKSIIMALMFNPISPSIYYGDEIGSLNIGLTSFDDFQDHDLENRKKKLFIKAQLSEKEIMDAQIMQAPINSRSLMAWNDKKNGGFSGSDKTITPVSLTHREINVKNQFIDTTSPLMFFKKINEIISDSIYTDIIAEGTFAITTLFSGVIKISFKLGKKSIRIFINLFDKVRKISGTKGKKVILSTYPYKKYDGEAPIELEAFESIMVSSEIDVYIKTHNDGGHIVSKPDKKKSNRNKVVQKSKKESTLKDVTKSKQKLMMESELAKEKARAKIERQVARQIKKDEARFSVLEEDILESDRTTLSEDEIAPTTQIDVDGIVDFDEFIKKNKK